MCLAGGLSYLTGQKTEPVGFGDNFQCDQSLITMYICKECLLELLQSVNMYLAHGKVQNYTCLSTELQYDIM
jgi:hypothetical protein